MNRIELEIEALSPLAVGYQKPGGSVSEALDYIPGSVIRGAIASMMIQVAGKPESGDDFHALFIDDNAAIFHNAYPATFGEGKKVPVTSEILVIPATALSSKTKDGFKPKNNGVFDTLIDRFCADRYDSIYDPSCPTVTGDRVDTFSGFYTKINDKYHKLSTSKRLLTRTGINRRRATSEESILYSIEVLNESQYQFQPKKKKPALYRSAILVKNETLATSLVDFINRFSEAFRLGGSISRGLGKVEIKAQIREVKNDLNSRIEEFNNKLKERWQTWSIFGQPKQELGKRTYFTINLQSDAILTEQWRRTTVISETMLQEFTGVNEQVQLEEVYSSYDYRSGWNSAWGLMKDVELVTNKGGVYLFSTSQIDSWLNTLQNLEYKGVGERTSEGFGQVKICNPFHLILWEEAK